MFRFNRVYKTYYNNPILTTCNCGNKECQKYLLEQAEKTLAVEKKRFNRVKEAYDRYKALSWWQRICADSSSEYYISIYHKSYLDAKENQRHCWRVYHEKDYPDKIKD